MNWVIFEDLVREVVVAALKKLNAEHAEERFYAYALYTDTSAMTIALATNSIEQLELKLLNESEEDREESIQYFKWSVSEWLYEAWDGGSFKNACKILRESEDRIDMLIFRQKLYEVMINVLSSLRRDGAFDGFRVKEPMLFITVTDDDDAESIENEAAKSLNSSFAYNGFIGRFGV